MIWASPNATTRTKPLLTVATAGLFDIAARDLAMAVGASTLSQVAALRGEDWFPFFTRAEGSRAHAGTN